MKGFEIQLSINKNVNSNKEKVRLAPPQADSDKRVLKDLQMSTQLAKLLDTERQIEDNAFLNQALDEVGTRSEECAYSI